MFIALGFLRTLQAERFVLQPKLGGERAARAHAALVFGNAHEALPGYTEEQLLCVL